MLVIHFRLLMAVLLKHHDIGHLVMNLVESPAGASKSGLPRALVDVCKLVHHTRRTLIKVLLLPTYHLTSYLFDFEF